MKRSLVRHPDQARLAQSYVDPLKSLACLPHDGLFSDGPTISDCDTIRRREGDRLCLRRFGGGSGGLR